MLVMFSFHLSLSFNPPGAMSAGMSCDLQAVFHPMVSPPQLCDVIPIHRLAISHKALILVKTLIINIIIIIINQKLQLSETVCM